jgi:serine protease
LIVAGAGNDGDGHKEHGSSFWPAYYDSVMSVAAVDLNKDVAYFSQRNNQVDIAAPGVNVLSTVPMGTGTSSSLDGLDVSGGYYIGIPMTGSPIGIASGTLVDCGIGENDCNDATGKICLIQRGTFTFAHKVLSCENGGGLGAVIYNNVDDVVFSGTLGETDTQIPSIGISKIDGLYLKENELERNSATITVGVSNYAYYDGTSMACPHVSGVAALIWSHDPTKKASEVRVALQSTAEDLGSIGRDNSTGYGLVQAAAALAYLTASSSPSSSPSASPSDSAAPSSDPSSLPSTRPSDSAAPSSGPSSLPSTWPSSMPSSKPRSIIKCRGKKGKKKC